MTETTAQAQPGAPAHEPRKVSLLLWVCISIPLVGLLAATVVTLTKGRGAGGAVTEAIAPMQLACDKGGRMPSSWDAATVVMNFMPNGQMLMNFRGDGDTVVYDYQKSGSGYSILGKGIAKANGQIERTSDTKPGRVTFQPAGTSAQGEPKFNVAIEGHGSTAAINVKLGCLMNPPEQPKQQAAQPAPAPAAESRSQAPATDKPLFAWPGSGEAAAQSKSSELKQVTGKVTRDHDPGGWIYQLNPASGPGIRIVYEFVDDKFREALASLEESGASVTIEGVVGEFDNGYVSFDDAKPITIRMASSGTPPESVARAQEPAPRAQAAAAMNAATSALSGLGGVVSPSAAPAAPAPARARSPRDAIEEYAERIEANGGACAGIANHLRMINNNFGPAHPRIADTLDKAEQRGCL